MKILVVPNYSKPEAVDGARRLTDWLEHEGLDVTWAHDKKIFPDKVIDISDIDLVVSLGGDGTLLRAASRLVSRLTASACAQPDASVSGAHQPSSSIRAS